MLLSMTVATAMLLALLTEQEIATFRMQQSAQAELARSEVGVAIKGNDAKAREKEGEGEAAYVETTGRAAGAEVRAVGLARAEAYERQVAALGRQATALVNAVEALSRGHVPFVPEVLVTGGGGALEGLAASLIDRVRTPAPAETVTDDEPSPDEAAIATAA